jgi:hypothetical protein
VGAKRLEDRVAGILARVERELDVAGGALSCKASVTPSCHLSAVCSLGCAGCGVCSGAGDVADWLKRRLRLKPHTFATARAAICLRFVSLVPPQRPKSATSCAFWTWIATEW